MDALNNEEMLLLLQQSLTTKRVLIIDRHPQARDALRIMLAGLGVTAIHGAGTSAEVIRQVHSHKFDIILSDFALDDGRDGQQLLEELRHTHLIPLSTVYIIITSERSYNNVVSLAELAPDDYLIKPFTADQLQGRLVRVIYKKHVLRRIYEQIEKGRLQEGIAACDRIIQQQPAYMYDGLRFKGELLQALGRAEEAAEVYRRALAGRTAPWAKMGLANALKERGELDEAERLAHEVIQEAPQYLAAYDFLAAVYEAQNRLGEAQKALQQAAEVSPNNTVRQRMVGDIASRNQDLLAAEKAYGKVLERHRGSSLATVDDFTNLSRVLVERGNTGAARRIVADMKRDWRGDKEADMAGLVMESLCLQSEGASGKAQQLLAQAIALRQQLQEEGASAARKALSQRLEVDLAHACFASGKAEAAQQIMRQVAAENNEDIHLIKYIANVFEKTGRSDAGRAMLDEVSAELIHLNNRGVRAARSGDLEGSVELLSQAADQVPNLQFLVNAAKAIFTLLDRKGWDDRLAERGLHYLQRAQQRDRRSPKVASARELYATVARKHGRSGS